MYSAQCVEWQVESGNKNPLSIGAKGCKWRCKWIFVRVTVKMTRLCLAVSETDAAILAIKEFRLRVTHTRTSNLPGLARDVNNE